MVKVFSNFDTAFPRTMLEQYINLYGKTKVIFIRRSVIFILYKIIIPLLLRVIGVFWALRITIRLSNFFATTIGMVFDGAIIVLLIALGTFILIHVFKQINDYFLDFTIITPKFIMEYDQMGIFSRVARSLDIQKIKSVRVDKKGLLKSLFNYGNIEFFGEGDQAIADISLQYIYDPLLLRDKISKIIHI